MSEAHATRQRLLDSGLQLVREKGLRGLGVREVARLAGANPGTFVYHFGTREAFLEEVVELWYVPFFRHLEETAFSPVKGNSLERLRATFAEILQFVADDSEIIGHLIADAVAGEPAARTFLLKVPPRHPMVILALIEEAQRDGFLRGDPPLHLFLYLMAAAGFPLVLAHGPLRRVDWLREVGAPLLQILGDIDLARQRLDWALQGITLSRGTL